MGVEVGVRFPPLREHLLRYGIGKDRLLFPAASDSDKHMAPSTLARVWHAARAKAGRDDLRYHDLHHFAATMTAQTGATTKETMSRLGHAAPAAAWRYQHSTRDAEIAEALSKLAEQT